MKIEFTAQIWREGSQFIAHAMPLDLASSGPTPDAARNALDEAVGLFLRTAAEHGTLEQVLEDAGYSASKKTWRGLLLNHETMKISYDAEIDALYIRLVEDSQQCRTVRLNEEIALNIGEHERLVGIEILEAKATLGTGQMPRIALENLTAVAA